VVSPGRIFGRVGIPSVKPENGYGTLSWKNRHWIALVSLNPASTLMRSAIVAATLVALFLCPVQSCRAQQIAQRPNEHVYQYSARTTIVAKADTLTLILLPGAAGPGKIAADTIVYLLGPDSTATQLRPIYRPMHESGRVVWRMLTLAKEQEQLENKLGISLHN
jgi:hypothetical protein